MDHPPHHFSNGPPLRKANSMHSHRRVIRVGLLMKSSNRSMCKKTIAIYLRSVSYNVQRSDGIYVKSVMRKTHQVYIFIRNS
jgi:hypothetical protein